MGRKGQLLGRILTIISAAAYLSLQGCMENIPEQEAVKEIKISFLRNGFMTKSEIPDEEQLNDINLLVFCDGSAEDQIWTTTYPDSHDHFITLNLLKGKRYSFFAFANFGRRITAGREEDIGGISVEMESADSYRNGIPMTAVAESVLIEEDGQITLELKRMMAKISLSIDRSRLSEDVSIMINSVRIGNCPRYATVAGGSKISGSFDCLPSGYMLEKTQCSPLNVTGQGGISGEVSLYMLENMQGDFPWQISADEEKVFEDDDPMASVCSYLEICADYRSDSHFSRNDLIYRFYLGDGLDNLDVERNCHYHIVVTPEDDGLSGSGWRVDKTGIGSYVQKIELSEESIEMTYKGESILLEAYVLPADAHDKSLRWRSSDSSVASVTSDGKVTASGEGDCVITCSAADGSGKTAACDVHVEYAPPFFFMYPGEYIEGEIGDRIHIWCEFFPPNAPFDPGLEELNYDKGRGIYDYEIDEDGHGVTLTLKNPGTGIVYMTAGAPVNESGMTIVVVNS